RNTGLSAAALTGPLQLGAEQLNRVCINALELVDDPQLGLKLGSRINLPAQGIFGYALLSSATVGDALKLLIRYNRALLPDVRIELVLDDDRPEILVTASHLPLMLERFYCEVLYAAIINSGRILAGQRATTARLELDYPANAGERWYHQIFGPDVRFSSTRRSLSFEAGSLELAIATANPLAQDIFRRECDRLLASGHHRGLISERVKQLLLAAGSLFPRADAVARQLHMSESTLQRRLAKEGLRYQQLLDDIRYRLAREYLVGTTLPVAEIAVLLGFSDATNFRRSFRRWSGTTPSRMRLLDWRDVSPLLISSSNSQ
ncbi:MAG TPA: AraC family transcriptional regulator ligand-binding domain-containing protein, partial [Kineobactrum sp.]